METRLCLIASASGVGGGEKNLLDIAKYFAKMDEYKVYAICPANGLLPDKLRELGVEVAIFPMPSLLRLGSILGIQRMLRSWQVDLVHAHGTRSALYARVASRYAGRIPCVYSIHGVHYTHYSNKILKWLFIKGERFLVNWTEKFICVCNADLEKCKEYKVIDPNKAAVVYNGLEFFPAIDQQAIDDVRHEFGINNGDKFILHASRLHLQKGQSYLVEAVPKVMASSSNVKFVLVGDGELRDSLNNQAKALGLDEDKVLFAGQRDDIQRLMQACDIFVLPSLWEGFPYVIIEAMAAGKPIVSTNVDGISEAIVNDISGILVEPGDSEAIAKAVIYLLSDDHKAKRYGQLARETFLERFTIDKMYADIRSLYEAILEK